jgi:hypothetical protein
MQTLQSRTTCPKCNYDLSGSPRSYSKSFQCPECGSIVPEIDALKLPWHIGSKWKQIAFTATVPISLMIAGFVLVSQNPHIHAGWYVGLTAVLVAWLFILPYVFSKLESAWDKGGNTRNAFTVYMDCFFYSNALCIPVCVVCWILYVAAKIGSIA